MALVNAFNRIMILRKWRFKKLMDAIIPPSDYNHRNGFTNTALIDSLTATERSRVEESLLNKLTQTTIKNFDSLVIETLVYLKSASALPILYDLLRKSVGNKLIICTSIFEISHDPAMIPIAIETFRQMDDKEDAYYIYKLCDGFCYLARFNTPETNKVIGEYVNHHKYLVSYNAKRFFLA